MRKIFAVVLFLALTVAAAYAEDSFVRQITIGRDNAGMTWYLTDYGVDYDTPYAVARKYYTSDSIKNDTIDMLISRYGIPETKANSLYFTEYRYEYTTDGAQAAEIYRRHYDMLGNLIFDNSANRQSFVNVVRNSIQSKGLAYAKGSLRK